MSAELFAQIDAQHQEAQAAEERAVAVMQRMKQVPGLTTLVDRLPRAYGEPPNPYKREHKNLTVIGVLERSDPALAHYLAAQAGVGVTAPDYSKQAQEAERAASIERVRQETERLAAVNAQRRQMREQAAMAGVSLATGRRLGS